MGLNVLAFQAGGERPGPPAVATHWLDRPDRPGALPPGGKSQAEPKSVTWYQALWFGLGYFACARAGHELSIQGVPYLSLWLPGGLYVAVLLLNPPGKWPAFTLAATIAGIVFSLSHGRMAGLAVVVACGNTVEALVGAWLVRRFVSKRPTLATLKEFLGLSVCTAGLGALVGSIIGSVAVYLTRLHHPFFEVWSTWWVSEAMAVLLVAPFILAWFGPTQPGHDGLEQLPPRRLIEAGLLVAGLAGFTWYMLACDAGILAPYKSRLLPFIVWAGLRFGVRGATTANLLLALLMTTFTAHFHRGLTPEQLASGDFVLTLQTFLLISIVVGLVPAIVLGERDHTVTELRESEERFRHFTAAAFEGIVVSEGGRIIDANDQALKLFGYERADLIGREILTLLTPESQTAALGPIRAESQAVHEHRMVCKDGRVFEGESQGRVFRIGERKVWMTALRDITERKRAQELRREQQTRRGLTMNMAKLGYWEFDTATARFTFDENFYRLFHTTAAAEGGLQMTAADYARKFLPPDEAAVVAEEIQRAITTPDANFTRQLEHRFIRADGSTGVMMVSYAVVKDAGGRTVKTFGANQDITELKHGAQALASSEALLRQFIRHTPAAISVYDTEMRCLQTSDRWLTDYQVEEKDIIGRSQYEVFPYLPERWKAVHQRVLAGAIEQCDEDSFQRPDGRTEWLQWEARPWRKAGGEIGGLVMFSQLITARKQIEAALRLSEERFRSAMHHSPIGMAIVNPDGRWLEVNPALCAIVGYTREQMLTLDFQSITHPDDLQQDLHQFRQMLTFELETCQKEKRYLHANGEAVWVQLNESLVRNPDGTPRNFVVQILDISRRKAAEKALHENRAKLLLAMEMSRLAHWEYDVAKHEFIADENLFRLYGTSHEEQGGSVMSPETYIKNFVHPEDAAVVGNEIALAVSTTDPNYTQQFEQRIIRKDGTPGVMITRFSVVKDAAGRTIKACGANQDITEQKQAEQERHELERQLRQAQKLEAIGTLAGGIAHDFNNILVGIMGNLQLAALDLPADHSVRPFLEEAEVASRRARDLVAQILTFSQRREQNQAPEPLGPIVAEALRLLRTTLPANIEVRTAIAQDCPPVRCDAGQIHQVIMNLGMNAAAAMRDHGGLLEIALEQVGPDATLRERHRLTARHRVRLSVRDTGSGMTAAVRDRIFEPFFTTRPPGQGTGLGLAMVHGIVQRHEGTIVVESTPGAGSTFHLYFPAVNLKAKPAPVVPPALGAAADGAQRPGRGERILLVDDEVKALEVMTIFLQRKGYAPVAFDQATEALAAFEREPTAYSAVVTDLTMPHMNGLELTERLRQLRTGLPVIMASGHLHADALAAARKIGINRFLDKPYELEQLHTAVRSALGPAVGATV